MNEVTTSRALSPGDLRKGIIRIAPAEKHFLPNAPTRLLIELRGAVLPDVRWHPMNYPDRERSGILTIGLKAMSVLREGQILGVTVGSDRVLLDLGRQ